MITIKYSNDLATDMFLISTAYSCSLDFSTDLNLPLWKYSNYFKNKVLKFSNKVLKDEDYINYTYCGVNAKYKNIKNMPDLCLSGYFHSPLYFFRNFNKNIFAFSEDIENYTKKKYCNYLDLENKVSIFVDKDFLGDTQKTLNYYKKAISLFPNTYNFIIISTDISWAKQYFVGDNFIFADPERSIIQMALSSYCDYHILSSNYISWWGAFLSEKNERVFCPHLFVLDGHIVKDPKMPYSWAIITENNEIIENRAHPTFLCDDEEIKNLFEQHLSCLDKKIQFEIDSPKDKIIEQDMYRVFVEYSLKSVLPKDIDKYNLILSRKDYNNKIFKNFNVGGSLIHNYNKIPAPPKDPELDKIFQLAFIYNGDKNSLGGKMSFDIFKNKDNFNVPRKFIFEKSNDPFKRKSLLKQSMFCIVLESERENGYFTDLLVDCFLYNVVPIYWGCPDIYKFFNHKGIINFYNTEDLVEKVRKLSDDLYYQLRDIIRGNRKKALYYAGTFHRIKHQVLGSL